MTLLAIFFIYGTDVSIESVLHKGIFNQMAMEVENLANNKIYLSTKDYQNYSSLFKNNVTHLPSFLFHLPDNMAGKFLGAFIFSVVGFFSILRRVKEIEVIVAQGTISIHGALANILFKKPVVLYLQYLAYNEQALLGRNILTQFFKSIEKLSIRNCTLLIAPNEKLKSEALTLGAKSIEIIPNFVNIHEIDKIESKLPLRQHLHLADSIPYLLFVGRLHPTKNLSALLDALSCEELSDCQLIIIGDGPLRHQLIELATNLGIKDRVHFLGFKPKELVLKYMKAADVLVLPSIIEGQPRVILEAWACKLPIVGSNVQGIKNLLENGKDGLLFNLYSKEDLSSSILKALDPKTSQALISNGRRRVQDFSEETVLLQQKRFTEIFLLKKKPEDSGLGVN